MGRSDQHACDPQGCQTLAPSPGHHDHSLCRRSIGRQYKGSGGQNFCAPRAEPPPLCFRVWSQHPQLLPHWERSPSPASCQSGSGSGQAHAVLTSGHWEAPKPCVLWFWHRGWGVSVPPQWRPGHLVVTHRPGSRALWELWETERAARVGKEAGARQHGSHPAWPVTPWVALQLCSPGVRCHIRQVASAPARAGHCAVANDTKQELMGAGYFLALLPGLVV